MLFSKKKMCKLENDEIVKVRFVKFEDNITFFFSFRKYKTGVRVRLHLNMFEMATKFMGSPKAVTLLEADCTLLGVYDPNRNKAKKEEYQKKRGMQQQRLGRCILLFFVILYCSLQSMNQQCTLVLSVKYMQWTVPQIFKLLPFL